MPTRLYLRLIQPAVSPTAGEKSSALPVGSVVTGTAGERALRAAMGDGTSVDIENSLAQTAHQDIYLARFSSIGLSAQTISAGTWTAGIAFREGNAAANLFAALSIYVWRPSTSAVVGYIYDSDTPLGAEWSTTATGRVFTFSGNSVTALANDILVLEVWGHAIQGMSTSYGVEISYNGTTDVTEGSTNTGSFIEHPGTIAFPGGPTPITSNKSAFIYGSIAQTSNKNAYIEVRPGIAFRASTGASTLNATSVTVSNPTGTANDDVLIVATAQYNDGLSATYSAPSGWTQIGATTTDGFCVLSMWWKRWQTGDPVTHIFTSTVSNGWAAAISAYSGVHTAAPIHAHAFATELAVSNTHTSPAITTTVDTWLINVFSDIQDTWTPPPEETEREDRAAASIVSVMLCDSNGYRTAGSQPGKTATASATTVDAVMFQMALEPTPLSLTVNKNAFIEGTSTPTAPTLSGTAGNTLNDLSWTAPSGATSYDLYRGIGGGGLTLYQADLTVSNYTDSGLTNGTSYSYYVIAKNANGSSPASNTVSLTPFASVSGTTVQRFFQSNTDQDQAWGTDIDKLTEAATSLLSTTIAQHPNAAGTTTITLDPYTSRSIQTEDNINFGWAINKAGTDGMESSATGKRFIPAGTWNFLNRVSLPAGGTVSGSHNVTGIYSVYRVTAALTRTLLFTHTSAESAGQVALASTVTINTTTASQPKFILEADETIHVAIQSQNRQVAGALGATTVGNLVWHTGTATDAYVGVPSPGIRTDYFRTPTMIGIGNMLTLKKMGLQQNMIGIGLQATLKKITKFFTMNAIGLEITIKKIAKPINTIGIGQETIIKKVRKPITVISIGLISLSKKFSTTLQLANFGAATVDRRLTLFRAIAPAGIGTMTQIRKITKLITTSGIGLVIVTRRLILLRAINTISIGLMSLSKKIAKPITAIGIADAFVTRRLTLFRAIANSGIGLMTQSRKIIKPINISGIGELILTRRLNLLRAIDISAIGLMNLSKKLGMALSFATHGATFFDRRATLFRAINTIGIGEAALSRALTIRRTISAVAIGLNTVVRKIGLNVSFIAHGAASFDRRLTLSRTITASAIGLVTQARKTAKTINFTGIGEATLNRALTIRRAITADSIGQMYLVRQVRKVLTMNAVGETFISRNYFKQIAFQAIGAASLAQRYFKVIDFIAIGDATLNRALTIRRSIETVARGAIRIFAKLPIERIPVAGTVINNIRRYFPIFDD